MKLRSKYFQNLVPNLDLKVPINLLCQRTENVDEVLAAISKHQKHLSIKSSKKAICGALRALVAFVQFKKREKHLCRSVNFSKVAGFSLQLY